ncbi:MAG: TetR family transcriptional regulator [Solirubrobacteraceae bacterium]
MRGGVRARRGVGGVQVAQIQRARILAAMFDVAGERGGVGSVSVADVVERSGVSRRTFYEVFSDREDCFRAAFGDALSFAFERVVPAYWAGGRWRERVGMGVVACLSFLDEEPLIGRLLVGELLRGTNGTRTGRERVLACLVGAVDEGREESSDATRSRLPVLTAEGLVGGALSIVDARLSEGSSVVGLAGTLVSMIVLPYLGPTVARREFERPAAQTSTNTGERGGSGGLVDPFKGAGLRLTYRTVRVLLAVSEHPGASNRTIGELAGIGDQGQISKLLGRLQRAGMLINTGVGPGQGSSNEWVLTPAGSRMAKSIRTHTNGVIQEQGE